jgi:hypothetical protein
LNVLHRPAAGNEEDMMTIATKPDLSLSNSLGDLAARIRAEHDAAGTALKKSVEHAMAAGEMLIEAKAQLQHGQWLPWLESCGIAERTAQRYVKLARNRVLIEGKPDTVSDLSISSALALVTIHRDSKEELVSLNVDLAERAIDCAFEWTDQDSRQAESAAIKALYDEAVAAIARMEELTLGAPALGEAIAEELHDFEDRITAGCAAYGAAVAAECGLTVDDLNDLVVALDDMERQGFDKGQRLSLGVKHYLRVAGEPRPGPIPLAVFSKVRDLVIEGLHRVERLVAVDA